MGTQHRHVLAAMPTGNISIARICVLLWFELLYSAAAAVWITSDLIGWVLL